MDKDFNSGREIERGEKRKDSQEKEEKKGNLREESELARRTVTLKPSSKKAILSTAEHFHPLHTIICNLKLSQNVETRTHDNLHSFCSIFLQQYICLRLNQRIVLCDLCYQRIGHRCIENHLG